MRRPAPLPQLTAPLPLSARRERKQVAWLEYIATIFMDVGADWAATEVNRDTFRRYQHSRTRQTRPARFFRGLVDRLAAKAERFRMQVSRAFGVDERARSLFLALKSGRVVDAFRMLSRPHFQYNQNGELLKMIVAVRMVVADATNTRSIVRFWSPAFGLDIRQKMLVLDYYFDTLLPSRCLDDVPQLRGVPYADAIRLRLLASLNRPLDPVLRRNVDLPGDEVAIARLASSYATGDLCAAGEVRSGFQSWFATPRLPQYARFFSRAANLCQGDLAWRNYNDFCQKSGSDRALPLALLLSSGCPQSVRVGSVSRLERLFWAQLWLGDCQNARHTLLTLRDDLARALTEHPSITIRYNYLVQSLQQCRASDRTASSAFSSPMYLGIVKLLEYGHYGDALFEWRMFHSVNCRKHGPLSDDIELLIRIAANPRAIYTPCLTGSVLTSDPLVNLEILRKADKYAKGARAGGGRFMASLLGSVRSEPAIRLRMKAAMIAGRLELAQELARRLPRDQEAAEISACAVLCSSRNSACHAKRKYAKLRRHSARPSVAISLGSAISDAVCDGVSLASYDPISIKYDLQLSVEEQLGRLVRALAKADMRTRFIDPRTGTWTGRVFHRRRGHSYLAQNVVPSEVMAMPPVPGLGDSQLLLLPVLDRRGRIVNQVDGPAMQSPPDLFM